MALVSRSYVFDTTEQIYVLQYYSIASITLLYYDHLLTFRMEVRRIWHRKFTLSSALFLLNRYITFFGYIFVIYLGFYPPDDIVFCRRFARVDGYLSLITQVIISILLSLRTYALYNRSLVVLCSVALLGLATVVTSAWALTEFFGILTGFGLASAFGGHAFRSCLPGFIASGIPFKVTFLLSTVFDSVVFLLTVTRTLQIVREHRKCGVRAGLPKLLMRDGSIYFAVMVLANVINIIFYSDPIFPAALFAQSTGNNAILSHIISVTMTSRLVLNLHGLEDERRKAAARPCRPRRQPRPTSNACSHTSTPCEGSSTDEDMTQFTTQMSRYSTWIARAADDFGIDWMLSSEDTRADLQSSSHSESDTIVTVPNTLSTYSTYFDDEESGWFDEDGENRESANDEICELPVRGNGDSRIVGKSADLECVKRLSKGHNVWWSLDEEIL